MISLDISLEYWIAGRRCRKLKRKVNHQKTILLAPHGPFMIVAIAPADVEILFAFLLDMVTALQQKSNITIFSWYPIIFHSQATNILSALRLSEQLMESDAKQFVLFQHEYLEQYKDYEASEAMRRMDELKVEAVRNLLKGGVELKNRLTYI